MTYAINGLGKKFGHIARIICYREKLPDFDNTLSTVLLEESVLNNNDDDSNSSFQDTSSSPTFLVAANNNNTPLVPTLV